MGKARIKEKITKITPYVPGVSSHDVGHPIIKLSSNENPFGPSPKAIAAICGNAAKANLYPDKESRGLRSRLSRELDIPAGNISIGNGSDDIIENLAKLFISDGDVLVTHSAYSTYQTVALSCGGERRLVPNPPEAGIDVRALIKACDDRAKILLICTPNNPTGAILTDDRIDELLAFTEDRGIFLILDEAYGDFSENYHSPANRIVTQDLDAAITRTFSKAHGLAGLRIAYCIAPERIQRFLNLVRMPFNANSLAQAAAIAALDDQEHYRNCVSRTRQLKTLLADKLSSLGLQTYPSEANFVLVSVGKTGHTAKSFTEALLKRGFAVRDCTSFGLPYHVRITVGTEEQISSFLSTLEEMLG